MNLVFLRKESIVCPEMACLPGLALAAWMSKHTPDTATYRKWQESQWLRSHAHLWGWHQVVLILSWALVYLVARQTWLVWQTWSWQSDSKSIKEIPSKSSTRFENIWEMMGRMGKMWLSLCVFFHLSVRDWWFLRSQIWYLVLTGKTLYGISIQCGEVSS